MNRRGFFKSIGTFFSAVVFHPLIPQFDQAGGIMPHIYWLDDVLYIGGAFTDNKKKYVMGEWDRTHWHSFED